MWENYIDGYIHVWKVFSFFLYNANFQNLKDEDQKIKTNEEGKFKKETQIYN